MHQSREESDFIVKLLWGVSQPQVTDFVARDEKTSSRERKSNETEQAPGKKSPTKATIETTVKLAMEICQEINKIIFPPLVPGIT